MGDVVNPVVLEKGLKTTFFKAYDAGTPITSLVATEVPSGATEEKYGWLGTAPAMREWVDERQPAGLLDHDYTIKNKKYEASIAIDTDTLEDDQTGQINIRVQDLGARARRHPDVLLADLINNGETNLCYDGQAFFDTDHSEGSSGTQDNDLTYDVSDTSVVTTAEAKAVLWQALSAMQGFVDDRGQPFLEEWMIDASNLVCMVAPGLQEPFGEALTSQLISNTTNTLQNKARLVVNARITSAVKVYLFYVGAPIKPFIFQRRRGMKTGMLGNSSETGFMRGKHIFGVDVRHNMGYGLWQYGVLTTLS